MDNNTKKKTHLNNGSMFKDWFIKHGDEKR